MHQVRDERRVYHHHGPRNELRVAPHRQYEEWDVAERDEYEGKRHPPVEGLGLAGLRQHDRRDRERPAQYAAGHQYVVEAQVTAPHSVDDQRHGLLFGKGGRLV